MPLTSDVSLLSPHSVADLPRLLPSVLYSQRAAASSSKGHHRRNDVTLSLLLPPSHHEQVKYLEGLLPAPCFAVESSLLRPVTSESSDNDNEEGEEEEEEKLDGGMEEEHDDNADILSSSPSLSPPVMPMCSSLVADCAVISIPSIVVSPNTRHFSSPPPAGANTEGDGEEEGRLLPRMRRICLNDVFFLLRRALPSFFVSAPSGTGDVVPMDHTVTIEEDGEASSSSSSIRMMDGEREQASSSSSSFGSDSYRSIKEEEEEEAQEETAFPAATQILSHDRSALYLFQGCTEMKWLREVCWTYEWKMRPPSIRKCLSH